VSEVQVILRAAHRPARVIRALAWLHLEVGGHRVTVVDDAREPGVEAQHRAACAAVGARHVGRGARLAWAEALAEGDPEGARLARAALVGPDGAFTAGAAMNSALLLAAGGKVMVLDDDVLPLGCSGAPGPAGPAGDPTALTVFSTRQAALRAHPPQRGALEAAWRAAEGAQVSVLGLLGDSGMRSAVGYLVRGGETLAALAEDWPRVSRSRQVLRAAPRVAVGRALTGAAVIVDQHLRALPPLLPALRNSDGLWGATLPEPARHLPWALLHAPALRRTSPEEARAHLVAPRGSEYLALAAGALPEHPDDWPALLRPAWRAHLERALERLDAARRAAPPGARAFHADVQACLRAVVATQAPPPPADVDWAALTRLAGLQRRLQVSWPRLVARARAGSGPDRPGL
jgi:hypothetical protein